MEWIFQVWFRFGFEKNRGFGFGLDFFVNQFIKYKKRVSCLSCVCILVDDFSKCSIGVDR